MSKRTAVIGATPNPSRYAFIASEMLEDYNHEVIPLGIKRGEVLGKTILNIRDKPMVENIHTVTLYIGPPRQPEHYEYILSLKPKRIIFNPGTENYDFEQLALRNNIEPLQACTLVLLRLGAY